LPAIDHSITTENLAKHMQHMSSLLNQCIIKINFAEKKLEKKSDHIQSVTDLIRIMTEIAVNLQNKKG
jgi:methyl-accepting chemotaxis protein